MQKENLTGHLVLLMAPSGSGKSLLLQKLRRQFERRIHFAVSCTTRKMRPGEHSGRVYFFLTEQEFNKKVSTDEFLEWAEYGGNRYGTLKSEIITPMEAGEVVMREVELQGVRTILNRVPRKNVTIIYIEAGSWETLKARITSRAPISESELALRHERFISETKAKHMADITVVNNEGRLEDAHKELVAILERIINNTKHNA